MAESAAYSILEKGSDGDVMFRKGFLLPPLLLFLVGLLEDDTGAAIVDMGKEMSPRWTGQLEGTLVPVTPETTGHMEIGIPATDKKVGNDDDRTRLFRRCWTCVLSCCCG